MMKDTNAKVIFNERLGDDYMRIGLDVGWRDYQPGQFVMLEIPGNAVFLRRPFSMACLDSGTLEIVYKIVGKGTEQLAGVQKAAHLNVLGPLGRGYDVSDDVKELILVAGGFGFAPLYGLAKSVSGKAIKLFLGARAAKDILYENKFTDIGVDVRVATEDGSKGSKGFVTVPLEEYLKTLKGKEKGVLVAACGPDAMLKEICKISAKYNVKAQVSLEEYMACGIGVCLGCVTKDRDGHFISTCKDGPVFEAERLAI